MPAQEVCFTAKLQRFDSQLWGHHIIVPTPLAEQLLAAGTSRVVCTLFEETTFQCALMTRGDKLAGGPPGKHFINLNQENRRKHGLRIGSEVVVRLRPDLSKYGLPMPAEMAELLAQDPTGDELFHALTAGKQRSLLYIVGKPKRTETRLKKAVVVVEHLKAHRGELDFKLLQEDMKAANQR